MFLAVGRLKPDVTMEAARAELVLILISCRAIEVHLEQESRWTSVAGDQISGFGPATIFRNDSTI